MGLITTNVNHEKKLVTIWLTNDEKNNASLRDEMKPFFAECKSNKYMVAVFNSGTEDLYDNTLALLCHNRNRSAEVEIQNEKRVLNG